VVKVSSTTSETEAATRATMSPAECRPCAVKPTGWPCQCHNVRTTSPGVTTESVAGSTTMPVKTGTNSQTRRMKNDTGTRDAAASASVPA
jgi:hypothetical protein